MIDIDQVWPLFSLFMEIFRLATALLESTFSGELALSGILNHQDKMTKFLRALRSKKIVFMLLRCHKKKTKQRNVASKFKLYFHLQMTTKITEIDQFV